MKELRIFSPATVANVSCGFDTLGFALETLGDEMVFRKTSNKEVRISKIEGANLPYALDENVVGVVVMAMLENHPIDFGIDIEIYKKFKPGSGLGSSAASASGAAFAINEFLNRPFSKLELTQFAMLGEEAACGSKIADNVSAALYGGFILVRSYDPLDIVKLPTPKDLFVTVVHPQIEVKTADARDVLKDEIPMKDAIRQWSNVGGLVSGLYTEDYDLIGRSLHDVIVEPLRKHLIPHFDIVQQTAKEIGALGAGISGSGPSIFALCEGEIMAKKVSEGIRKIYSKTAIGFEMYTSKINAQGVKIIESI